MGWAKVADKSLVELMGILILNGDGVMHLTDAIYSYHISAQ